MLNKATKAIIQDKKNKYLFQLRDNLKEISSPNKWGFFGGKVIIGEKPSDCMIRELKEELNIRTKVEKEYFQAINFDTNFLHFFFKVITLDKVNENNLTEGQALGWFTIEQIKKKNMAWEVHKFIEFKNEKKV